MACLPESLRKKITSFSTNFWLLVRTLASYARRFETSVGRASLLLATKNLLRSNEISIGAHQNQQDCNAYLKLTLRRDCNNQIRDINQEDVENLQFGVPNIKRLK
jgi:predicted membrane chloride channel (bestrophin family)